MTCPFTGGRSRLKLSLSLLRYVILSLRLLRVVRYLTSLLTSWRRRLVVEARGLTVVRCLFVVVPATLLPRIRILLCLVTLTVRSLFPILLLVSVRLTPRKLRLMILTLLLLPLNVLNIRRVIILMSLL